MTVEDRLEKLERQNSRLRLAVLGLAVLFGLTALAAAEFRADPDGKKAPADAKATDVVKAKEFQLVADDDGKQVLATLRRNKDTAQAELLFYTAGQKDATFLHFARHPQGPGVVITDRNMRAMLTHDGLHYQYDGKDLVRMGVARAGDTPLPQLELKQGKGGMTFDVDPKGSRIVFYDPSGTPVFQLASPVVGQK